MIGQAKLIEKINNYKELPRFIILNGMKGCGKKTLAKEIAKKFELEMIYIGVKVDEIRGLIKLANEYNTKILFYIDDGNRMSISSSNALLKITEETPNNSYIILSVENKELLPSTILSRGVIFNFNEYTNEDFENYLNLKESSSIPFNLIYPNLSYLEILNIDEANELFNYCINFKNNVRKMNGADAFKLTEKIKLNDEQQGWNLTQFIWCLKSICRNSLINSIKNNNKLEYYYMLSYIKILTNLQQMLSNNSFNKNYILDKLIIDFKKIQYI